MVNSNYVNSPNSTKISYYEPSTPIKEKMSHSHDYLLSGNIINKTKASLHKTGQAFTTYPSKGLKGDQNSNFYEFLAMGIIPYIVGSLTMMAVFNAATPQFSSPSQKAANKIGKKLAIGVVLYVLAKELAKKVVEMPVKIATGVDLGQPYKRFIHELPPNSYEKGKTRVEYHKVFESVDFPREDLLYSEGNKVGNRNAWFDKIAQKNGFGELQASDQEMKPRIKELAIKAQTWKTILAYAWAATAVGIAAQTPWEEFGVNKGNKIQGRKNFIFDTFDITKRSFKEMWKGGAIKSKSAGIFGKTLLLATAALSIIAPIATISGFRSKNESKSAVDESKRYYEV
jgi:hypothetical protein